jgi:hypothetical protein
MPNLKIFTMRALVPLLGLMPVCGMHGQEEGGGAPPKPMPKVWERGDRERGPGDRGPGEGGPGYRGGRDRDRDRGDMFRNLSDSERRQVREAFEKVWVRPEVEAARERLRVANDEYRKVMQEAMAQVDPEVVKLLEKSRPKPPPLPEVNDPEFARKVLERLRFEGPLRGDREGQGRIYDKVINSPAMRELVKQLREAPPEKRLELWQQLRERYQREAREFGPGPGPGSRGQGGEPSPTRE